MKRVWVIALAGCLLTPVAASAKGGVIWDRYPDVQAVGSPMKFTAMLLDNRGTPGEPLGGAIEGARPLVTFRNSITGEVVRVRGTRSDLNGISYGTVRLPSTGPWDTKVTVAGREITPGDSQPFRVGVGLTQTIPAADAVKARAGSGEPDGDGSSPSPWLWLTSIAAIGSALLVFVMRRRGRWGAA